MDLGHRRSCGGRIAATKWRQANGLPRTGSKMGLCRKWHWSWWSSRRKAHLHTCGRMIADTGHRHFSSAGAAFFSFLAFFITWAFPSFDTRQRLTTDFTPRHGSGLSASSASAGSHPYRVMDSSSGAGADGKTKAGAWSSTQGWESLIVKLLLADMPRNSPFSKESARIHSEEPSTHLLNHERNRQNNFKQDSNEEEPDPMASWAIPTVLRQIYLRHFLGLGSMIIYTSHRHLSPETAFFFF